MHATDMTGLPFVHGHVRTSGGKGNVIVILPSPEIISLDCHATGPFG